MSGWRDSEGQTPSERARDKRAENLDTLRHRPLSLVKPALALLFVLLLVAALVLR
jgi:hypothetical protein